MCTKNRWLFLLGSRTYSTVELGLVMDISSLVHDHADLTVEQVEIDLGTIVESSIECLDRTVELLVGSVDDTLLWDTFHAEMLCGLTIVIDEFVIVNLLASTDVDNSTGIVLELIEVIVELTHIVANKDPVVLALECGGKMGKFIGLDVHGVCVLVIDIDSFVLSETHDFIHDSLGHRQDCHSEDNIVEL